MSEPLALMDDDDEGPHPATPAFILGKLREARGILTTVVSTGDKQADGDLLEAEQALRRVVSRLTRQK